MRTRVPCLIAAVAVLAVSCGKEPDTGSVPGLEYGTLCARWSDDALSRTEIQPDGTTVMWAGEERINVFFGAEYMSEFVSTRYGKRKETEFTGLVPTGFAEGSGGNPEIWALYPYDEGAVFDGEAVRIDIPSGQEAKMGSFADNFFPAVARASGPDQPLVFYNVCGGACFSVTEVGIGKITFQSLGGELLAGTMKVGLDASGRPEVLSVVEGVDTIVMMAPEGGFSPGKAYYVTFIPQTLSGGLSIKCYKGRSVAERRIERSLTVNRSRFGRLDGVDEGLVYVEDASEPNPSDIILFADARVKAECVAAFDTDGDGELSYQEAAAATSLTGVFHSKLGTMFDELRYFTGLTEIPDGCFKDWALLKRITLPEGVVAIGANAFWGCRSLKSVNFPLTLSRIGVYAFHDCVSLTEVSVGSLTQWLDLNFPAVTSLYSTDKYDSFPFYSSGEGHLLIKGEELTSLTIPDSYSEIRAFAFRNCRSITEVILPSKTKTIGIYAFSGCTHLIQVHIPNAQYWLELNQGTPIFGIDREGHIYSSGKEIKSFVVPESTSSLGNYTFYCCTGLDSIILESIIPPAIGPYTFYGTLCPIYVWEGCLDMYLSDSNWKDYWKQLSVNPGIP